MNELTDAQIMRIAGKDELTGDAILEFARALLAGSPPAKTRAGTIGHVAPPGFGQMTTAIPPVPQDSGAAPSEACLHDETERLGAIWTHCTQCGKKWADDDPQNPLRSAEPTPPALERQAMERALRSLEAAYNVVCEFSEGAAASEAAQFIHADMEEVRAVLSASPVVQEPVAQRDLLEKLRAEIEARMRKAAHRYNMKEAGGRYELSFTEDVLLAIEEILSATTTEPVRKALSEEEIEQCVVEVVKQARHGGATLKDYEEQFAAAVQRACAARWGIQLQGESSSTATGVGGVADADH